MSEAYTSKLYKLIRDIVAWKWFHIFRMRASGLEHIPISGAAIIITNHKSNWDPFAVAACANRQMYFLSKAEVFRTPVIGYIAGKFEAIPVERGGNDMRAMRECQARLKEGRLLAVSPEGTRVKRPGLGKFEHGVAMIALRSGAPIIPGYLEGRPLKRLSIRFGPPIDLSDLGHVSGESIEIATRRMEAAVAVLGNIAQP